MKYIRENLEWREIPNLEGRYEVSNYGDIKRLEYDFIDKIGRHLYYEEKIYWSEDQKEYGGDNGVRYLGVNIPKIGRQYAHRIAAMVFIPNPNNKPEINHIDGNTKHNYCGCAKNNYNDSNLEWVTHKENMEHASKNGLINHESVLRKYACAKNREKINYDSMKKPVVQLTKTGEFVKEFESIAEASRTTKVEASTIREVCAKKGYRKSAGGYIWVHKENYDPATNYSYSINLGANKKKVLQYDLEGNFIAEYKSITDACKDNGWGGVSYISYCCNGRKKSYKGYVWKYKD